VEQLRKCLRINDSYFKLQLLYDVMPPKRRLTDQQRRERHRIRLLPRPKPQPCEICGASAQRHHIDYADPERIMWLCQIHHAQTHSQFGRPAPVDWMADIRAAVARIDAERIASRNRRAADGEGVGDAGRGDAPTDSRSQNF